jgi:acyl-CoA reductase-like NAD-dependent aldehyde dehydrogenase
VPPQPQDLPGDLYLEGRFEPRAGRIAVASPFDGSPVASVALASPDDLARAVASARRRVGAHPPVARAEILERAARLVAERAQRFARTIALEAGKPLRQARVEVARCVDTLTFSAIEARTTAGEAVPMEGSRAGVGKLGLVAPAPVGVVGAISPFNFPLNLVAHKVGPAIAAGCPVVLKPAEQTPVSALLLAEALHEAGLESGDLAVLPGPGTVIGAALVEHPDVEMITFTGSSAVGWSIRSAQPRKRVSLELGNSTPAIVHADADVALAAERIAASGFTHAGQSCVSVQRVYAHESIIDDFSDRLLGAVRALTVGDPLDEATEVGPVIDAAARERIERWIDEAVGGGGELVETGELGAVLCPTVLLDVPEDGRLIRDEVFGPVVSIQRYGEIDDAIDRANGTPYGLQAGIFTARVDRALGWARRLRFGGVTINETPTFRADQQPYGGVKDSGNTREGPKYAVRSMTEGRLVVIDGIGSA